METCPRKRPMQVPHISLSHFTMTHPLQYLAKLLDNNNRRNVREGSLMSHATRNLGFALFSAFILWHIVAITVVGPSSKSYMRDNLMVIFGPYLKVLNLDRSWPFYAPNPFFGSVLSYEISDDSGHRSSYPLTQARTKIEHGYFRYTNFYAYLFSDAAYSHERGYDRSVARYLCKKHALGQGSSIYFMLRNQQKFTFEDYRRGKRPMDDEFLKTTNHGPYPC